jgi:hypothetical protein
MPDKDWIESTDAGLLTQSADVAATIAENLAGYHVSSAQSAQLSADQAAYALAYEAAKNPGTRTPVKVAEKQAKKKALIKTMRAVGQQVQVDQTISDALKIAMSLKPRDFEPTPILAPSVAPALTALGVFGRNVRCRATDPTQAGKRRKPEGVAGAKIFSFTGEEPSADIDAWKFEGLSTRSDFDVVFGPAVAPGTKVWICACWYSPRGASGPVSAAVSAFVGGGVSGAAA